MWQVAPATNQRVQIILGPQHVQCAWLEQSNNIFTLKAYQEKNFDTLVTFTNPTLLQNTIKTFLQESNVTNASISLALDLSETAHVVTLDTIPPTQKYTKWLTMLLHEDGYYVHSGIKHYQLTQSSLLAINTPFHCAGITTYQLAQLAATQKLSSSWPTPTAGITEYIAQAAQSIEPHTLIKSPLAQKISPQDLLTFIGVYTMTGHNDA